jgi:hypothetical protein
MSYLDRLMAQTGIDLVPAAARVEPAPSIVEIDVHQIVPPAAAPVSPAAPVAMTVSVPDRAPAPDPLERTEQVTTAPIPTAAPTPEARTPLSHARAAEPLIPEIVIEQRPTQIVTEPAPRSLEQTVYRSVAPEQEVITAPRATSAPKKAEVPSDARQAAATPKHPTFIEIRNWVTATPAADESAAETRTPKTEPYASSQPARSMTTCEASVIRRAEAERVPVPEAPHVELSIGTVQVIVEAPATPVQPARPQPPPSASPAAGELPSWSRLSRRYIRL